MKKIVFLTRSYYPNIGGVEKHIWEISKILAKQGFFITIIAERPQIKNITHKFYGISSNIEVLHIPNIKENTFKKYLIWFNLLKYINKIAYADVIHCHDVFFWYFPFRFVFPFKKVFTTFHGYEGDDIPNAKAKIMHKIGEKLSDGNICVGNFFKKWYGTQATFVIYGGVDLKKINIRENIITNKAAYIGRLEPEAGIMDYLFALKLLKKDGYLIKLDVFGNGSQFNQAQKYCKNNNLNVSFKGFINNIENVIPKYKFIFVSRYLGILESLAAGKQVFAVYNNLIKKDYLEMMPISKNIYICKNNEDIKESIKNYLKNDKLKDISGASNWARRFSWEKITSIYLKLWNIR